MSFTQVFCPNIESAGFPLTRRESEHMISIERRRRKRPSGVYDESGSSNCCTQDLPHMNDVNRNAEVIIEGITTVGAHEGAATGQTK